MPEGPGDSSSGDETQLGANGDATQIGANPDATQIGGAGDRTVVAGARIPVPADHSRDATLVGAIPLSASAWREQFHAALASRNAAAVQALLERIEPEAAADIARTTLAEVTALQASARVTTPEALNRHLRNYPDSALSPTVEYLLAKAEDAAFAVLLQTRARRQAAKFLKDFPGSTMTPNVQRLLTELDDRETFKHAASEVRRGNLKPARDAVFTIVDQNLRNELLGEVQRYEAADRQTRLRLLWQYVLSWLTKQFSAPAAEEFHPKPTPAARELQVARDHVLNELHEIAEALRAKSGGAAANPGAAAVPVPQPRPVPAEPRPWVPLVSERPARRHSFAPLAGAMIAIAAIGAIFVMYDEGPAELRAPIRRLASMIGGTAAPEPVTAGLRIEVLPSGSVVSVSDGTKEWLAGPTPSPAELQVPPGTYDIAVVGPDGSSRKAGRIELAAGANDPVVVSFADGFEPAPK